MTVTIAMAWLLCAGTAGAVDHAEILFVVEVDSNRLTSGADQAGTASFEPAMLAATLAEAVTIDVHLFEPVAAIPYPSIAIAFLDEDGEPAGLHWLQYEEDYAPAGGYRFSLPGGTAATLAGLPGGSGGRALQVIAIEDLGFVGADRRVESALHESVRMLAEQRAIDGPASVPTFAISIVAVPRTVETFVADAGKGGGVTVLLRYEASQP